MLGLGGGASEKSILKRLTALHADREKLEVAIVNMEAEAATVAVENPDGIVEEALFVETMKHRAHFAVVGDAEGADGDRPLHEVGVPARDAVFEREAGPGGGPAAMLLERKA